MPAPNKKSLIEFKDLNSTLSKLNNFPITLKSLNKIILKVHKRYPLISKHETDVIIKLFLDKLRTLLIKGFTINFTDYFINLHLKYYKTRFDIIKFHIQPSSKIKKYE